MKETRSFIFKRAEAPQKSSTSFSALQMNLLSKPLLNEALCNLGLALRVAFLDLHMDEPVAEVSVGHQL